MNAISVSIGDESRSFAVGVTVLDVAQSISNKTAKRLVGGIIDRGEVVDVHTPLSSDCALELVKVGSDAGLGVLRHSVSHLMASAVQSLFPGTKVTIGPAIENGFYYDFDRDGGFSEDDLGLIEAEMHRLAALNEPFVREEIEQSEARSRFEGLGETYKLELLEAIPEGDVITLYRHGDWFDLCRGPHVPRTGMLGAFKLQHLAGAYWRGDERRPMLTRIYGTAFWDKKGLKRHLAGLEEAKKRDHRVLGPALDLFSFHDVAPAMPFFHPRGTVVYNALKSMISGYYREMGFHEVITPQIVDSNLYKRSGHYANFHDNMFFSEVDGREYGVKPMNCPGHTLIYSNSRRSYRELPLRIADFGRLHRNERSGVVGGLTRVRSFCQDDAHIFCMVSQIKTEIGNQIAMIQEIYSHFGFEMKVGFSTRPEVSIGREDGVSAEERAAWDDLWELAEETLREAIEGEGVVAEIDAGEGAFYGPKLDFQVRDALGRWFQLGTVQLDFAMPRRFDLKYISPENTAERPVMVHRAVLGSLERFMGILIEHTGGDFPVWLAPVQVRVLPVSDEFHDFGHKVAEALHARGVRVGFDRRSEKLGYKIRDGELHKIPYLAVVGAREVETSTVTLRGRRGVDHGTLAVDQTASLLLDAAQMPVPSTTLTGRVARDFLL